MRALRGLAIAIYVLAATTLALAIPAWLLRHDLRALRWEQPWLFLGLLVVPLVGWRATLGEDDRVPRLFVGSVSRAGKLPVGWRARLVDMPGVLRAAALTLAVLAMARPQSIVADEVDERSGIDIMVALDLSGSMAAADLKPTRLEAAKAVVQELIERRPDDRIGAVVFAGDAWLISPPTFDHVRLAQLVGRMDLRTVSRDGTAIGDGIATALAKLRNSKSATRVVVLLTDGDNNAGSMNPEYALGLAKELGIKIYSVQMGNGDEVEVEVDRDPFNRPIYQRRRFPVNPELLKRIAKETGAEFYIANQTEELRSSMHQILDKLQKTRFEAASGEVVERFPYVLIPAGVLFVLEALARALILRRYP